jgi:hypothetical protein
MTVAYPQPNRFPDGQPVAGGPFFEPAARPPEAPRQRPRRTRWMIAAAAGTLTFTTAIAGITVHALDEKARNTAETPKHADKPAAAAPYSTGPSPEGASSPQTLRGAEFAKSKIPPDYLCGMIGTSLAAAALSKPEGKMQPGCQFDDAEYLDAHALVPGSTTLADGHWVAQDGSSVGMAVIYDPDSRVFKNSSISTETWQPFTMNGRNNTMVEGFYQPDTQLIEFTYGTNHSLIVEMQPQPALSGDQAAQRYQRAAQAMFEELQPKLDEVNAGI